MKIKLLNKSKGIYFIEFCKIFMEVREICPKNKNMQTVSFFKCNLYNYIQQNNAIITTCVFKLYYISSH